MPTSIERLAVRAVRGREHQRRRHRPHARLEERAEEELLDDHRRDDDRDPDPERARDQPDDHGRDRRRRLPRPDACAREQVPERARSRSPSRSSGPSPTTPMSEARRRGRRRAGRSEPQEFGQRAAARERVVAGQEEDAGSRARRRPRRARAAGSRASRPPCPPANGIATVRSRTRAEQAHRDGAPARLGEAVLGEDRARARLREATGACPGFPPGPGARRSRSSSCSPREKRRRLTQFRRTVQASSDGALDFRRDRRERMPAEHDAGAPRFPSRFATSPRASAAARRWTASASSSPRGETLGLLGPNGAGKTTLVRTVAGRVVPDGGAPAILGLLPVGRRRAGGPRLGPAGDRALSPAVARARTSGPSGATRASPEPPSTTGIRKSLDWIGLADRADEKTDRLSGGMKRRLNIAAGTIHGAARPPARRADRRRRPAVARAHLRHDRRAQVAGGVSLLYTTHYMEEAERLCDRIAIIDNGRIIALGHQGRARPQDRSARGRR